MSAFYLPDADRTPRRLFAQVQAGKGLVGLMLGLGYALLIGPPDALKRWPLWDW